MRASSRYIILSLVAGGAFALGVVVAGVTFGSGVSVSPAASPAVSCDPPCSAAQECLRGICVAPPAALPAMESLTAVAVAPASAPSVVRAVEIGSIRHIKCEGPLFPEARCFKSMQPLRRSLERHEPRLTDCYEKVALTEPDLVGVVNLVYDIDFANETYEVAIDKAGNIEHPVIKECVMKAAEESFTFELKHYFEWERLAVEVSFGYRPVGFDD